MSSQNSPRLTLIVFLTAIILIALAGLVLLASRPQPAIITIHPPLPSATPLPTATPKPILVYVTGEVQHRGTLHYLPYGSRISDAIAAAGGFTDGANRTLVNLAGIARDGDQIHVPARDVTVTENTLPTPSGGRRIYINTATQAELETLPGIGPATAARIIEYRDHVDNFASLEDLDQVAGIGEVTLESLRDLIAFD